MAGIKDVAKKAGVGVGTVSRFLNNSGYVSAAAREKIQHAMEELDYTPNELARNLSRKKAGIIAVLVPSISNTFFSELLEHIERILNENGYKTMLCNTVSNSNSEAEYLDMLNRHIVDGIITCVHTLKEEEYRQLQKPIVALDCYLSENIPIVAVDHKLGGRLAAQALIESGCRNVVQFTVSDTEPSPFHDRHQEFERVMKEHGVHVTNHSTNKNCLDLNFYRKVVDEVLSQNQDYDGVFGVDPISILYSNEVLRRGKRVPEDVRIVGYDGTYLADCVRPRLTTIVQPTDKLAKTSCELLLRMISGECKEIKNVLIDVTLRQGGSTICPTE